MIADLMSKHRAILPRIVADLAQRLPRCAILLTGSVADGQEVETSDIDLLVCVPYLAATDPAGGRVAFQNDQAKVIDAHQAAYDGIAVTLNCLTFATLRQAADRPWIWYLLAHAPILHDPHGTVAAARQPLLRWFHDHPDIAALWSRQVADYRQSKRAAQRGENQPAIRFPMWQDFVRHVESVVQAAHHPGAIPPSPKPG